jgi:hypothetical protein
MTGRQSARFFAEGFLQGFTESLLERSDLPARCQVDTMYDLMPGWVRVLAARHALAAQARLSRAGNVAMLLHAETVRACVRRIAGEAVPLHDPFRQEDLPVLHEVFAPCFARGAGHFDRMYGMRTPARRFRVTACGPDIGDRLCAMMGSGGTVAELTLEVHGASPAPAVLLISGRIEADYSVLGMVYADAGKRGASGSQAR